MCVAFSFIAVLYVASLWHTGLIHFTMAMLVQAKKMKEQVDELEISI